MKKQPLALDGVTAPVPVVALRDMTADQRAKVRELIEQHFDEDKGCYLDGYSDEKIAIDVNVPRIHVEHLRDAAYGPIRISAEVIAMQKDLDALRLRIASQLTAAESLFETFKQDIAAMQAELIAMEQRLKLAA